MATATVTGSFSTLHDCENTNNIISNKTISVDADTFRENANAVGMMKVSQERAYMYYDYYTAHSNTAWNLSSSPTHIFIWINVANASGLATIGDAVNGAGIRIYLTDGSGNTGYWHVGGSDTYFGGWECFVVYSGTAFDSNNGTDPTLSDIRHVGMDVYQSGKTTANALNVWMDYLHYGAGISVHGGTNGDEIGLQEIYDVSENTTNAFGILKRQAGSWVLQAPIKLGDDAGTNTIYYLDKNEIIIWADRPVSSTHYKLSVVGNATGTSSVIWGEKSGTVGINGCVISDDSGLAFDLDFSAANVDTVVMYGGTLIGYGTITGNPSYEADKELLSCVFNLGALIDINAMICKFFTVVGATTGIQLDATTHYVSDGSVIGCTVGIQCTVAGTFGITDVTFTGNTTDIRNTTSAVLVDSYQPTEDGDVDVYNGSITRVAQQFTGTAGKLSRAIFSIRKQGSPTGNVVAKLYANSSGAPTGVAIATSNTVDIAGFSTSFADIDFEFEDEYTLIAATEYHISIEYSGGDASNRLEVEYLTVGDAGEACNTYTGSWGSQTYDCRFASNRNGIVKINATDSDPGTAEETASVKGATIIVNTVNLYIRCKDKNNDPIGDVRCSIHTSPGNAELMNEDSNSSTGIADASYNYEGAQDIYWRVRESPVGGDRYKARSGFNQISADGMDVTVVLEPETVS